MKFICVYLVVLGLYRGFSSAAPAVAQFRSYRSSCVICGAPSDTGAYCAESASFFSVHYRSTNTECSCHTENEQSAH